ncbi:MAG: hypothetical protein V3S30_10280 [Thermoanaerobaculia bacterium]
MNALCSVLLVYVLTGSSLSSAEDVDLETDRISWVQDRIRMGRLGDGQLGLVHCVGRAWDSPSFLGVTDTLI